jgi:hypothetical protein
MLLHFCKFFIEIGERLRMHLLNVRKLRRYNLLEVLGVLLDLQFEVSVEMPQGDATLSLTIRVEITILQPVAQLSKLAVVVLQLLHSCERSDQVLRLVRCSHNQVAID